MGLVTYYFCILDVAYGGACNHRIGPERTGSEVITGSDLILH